METKKPASSEVVDHRSGVYRGVLYGNKKKTFIFFHSHLLGEIFHDQSFLRSLWRDDLMDVLCIAEWGGTISFYTIAGRPVGRERMTNFIPLKVTHFPEGQYILVCGSNEKCLLMTHEGIQLATVGEPFSSWVWSCAVHPSSSHVVSLSTPEGLKNYKFKILT